MGASMGRQDIVLREKISSIEKEFHKKVTQPRSGIVVNNVVLLAMVNYFCNILIGH
jgi:hypothetical protein